MAEGSSISVVCACGKKLKAPSTAVGRKARCPACGNTVVLTANAPAMVSAASPPPLPKKAPVVARATVPPDDDDLGALYELAGQAESAAPPAQGPACPSCHASMDKGAVLCMSCGYDTRTGKALSTSSSSAKPVKSSPQALGSKKSKEPVDLMAPQGSFVLGVVLCAAFALAASLVWIAIAWLTGFTIGYIAILIGGAAGIGMRVGHKGFSTVGGMIASAMTLAAILAAKVVVIELVLARQGLGRSIFDLDSTKLGFYFLSPIGLIIIAIGMGAAYRTANGSSS